MSPLTGPSFCLSVCSCLLEAISVYVCLSSCVFACLSASLPPSVSFFTYLSDCLSAYVSVYLSAFLAGCLLLYLLSCLSCARLSFCVFVYLFVCLLTAYAYLTRWPPVCFMLTCLLFWQYVCLSPVSLFTCWCFCCCWLSDCLPAPCTVYRTSMNKRLSLW